MSLWQLFTLRILDIKNKTKMGYEHIQNLYKDNSIMMFKEAYALEKIHGCSAHISWKYEQKEVRYFSGGEDYSEFVKLFDIGFVKQKFIEIFPDKNVKIHGEAYGGTQQGMSKTYGDILKFIVFDVKVDGMYINVPNAEKVAKQFNLEFVDYVKIPCTIEAIEQEKMKDSVQAIRNGMGEGKIREGVVLRPLIELRKNNDERIMCKHRRDEFSETKTPRLLTYADLKVLSDADEVADEYVTNMRFQHVISKLPKELTIGIRQTKFVIEAMVEDVYREAKGEIIESKEVYNRIGKRTAELFRKHLGLDKP
jgi:hypothetical protein